MGVRLRFIRTGWTSGTFSRWRFRCLWGGVFLPNEQNAVVVSEALARRQWPGENPLGKKYGENTVVGVAGNAHVNAMNDGDALEAYYPAQPADIPDMVVLVKSVGAPDGLTPMAKSIVEKSPNEVRFLSRARKSSISGIEKFAFLPF